MKNKAVILLSLTVILLSFLVSTDHQITGMYVAFNGVNPFNTVQTESVENPSTTIISTDTNRVRRGETFRFRVATSPNGIFNKITLTKNGTSIRNYYNAICRKRICINPRFIIITLHIPKAYRPGAYELTFYEVTGEAKKIPLTIL